MVPKKTDNANLPAKLRLRRYFLDKYHADGNIRVMDCCQGSGVIWSHLQQDYALASYTGYDMKPKPGRLKIDSVRVLQQKGWTENVIDIDIDTYGSPWKHWEAMLPNASFPLTVFLTAASKSGGGFGGGDSVPIISELRLPPSSPKVIADRIGNLLGVHIAWAIAERYCRITEAVEAISAGNARYIGVRLEPLETATAESLPRPRPKRTRKSGVSKHV